MTAGVGALLLLAVLVFVADEDTILEEAMDNLKESYIGGRVVANLGCYLGGRALLEELEGVLDASRLHVLREGGPYVSRWGHPSGVVRRPCRGDLGRRRVWLGYVDSEYRIEGDSQGVLVALPLTGCTSKRVPLKDAHPLRVTVTNPGQCAHFLDVHVGTDNPHPSSFQDECALLASYHRCRGIKDDVHGRVDAGIAGIRQARSRDSSRRNDIFGRRSTFQCARR